MAFELKSSAVTTYRPSSSGISLTPSALGSQDPRLQSEMKGIIELEIKGATYYVDLTAKDSILSAEPRIVQAVTRDLKTTLDRLTDEGESSPTDPRLPQSGFRDEPSSYEPFMQLLNKIIDTASKHIPPSPLAPLVQLHFYRFGKEVKETYGIEKGLKPGGVGILGPLPTDTKDLSWEHIEVIIESKISVRDMVRQSGTYARCCLIGNQRRLFSLVIGFNFSTLEAYVFLFHRSGLSSSRPLNVTTQEGFEGLVRHIVGILTIRDEAAYGLDPTRFQNVFCINGGLYELVRLLYMRDSLYGRATVVYSLQGASARAPTGGELKSRTLTLSDGIGCMPDKFTYKQAYHIKGRSEEGPLLSRFKGQFGIADVIGYHNCGAEDPHGSMERLFTNAEPWNVFKVDNLPEDREPEKRALQCIALAGEGIGLDDVDAGRPSPSELLESILHAIIGHYNLFDKGVLHRDISSGNVLRYSEPVERSALDEFEFTRNVNLCRGFVIDGDQAIKWREATGSQEISGTMYFMSMRILGIWLDHGPIFHTALDDLESFLWLLIWCIVHLTKDIEGARANNPGINQMLRVWSGDVMANRSRRQTIGEAWDDAVFGCLIREWSKVFDWVLEETRIVTKFLSTAQVDNRQGSGWTRACDRLESFCKKTYEEILQSGFKHLADVQRYSDWEAVVAANEPTIDLDSDF